MAVVLMAFFTVLKPGNRPTPDAPRGSAYLVENLWNDWWEYSTLYDLMVVDLGGVHHSVGATKIGEDKLAASRDPQKPARPNIPVSFDTLEETFFSLGQTEDYYQNLFSIGPPIFEQVLKGLNDMALSPELLPRFRRQYVMIRSVLRSVTPSTIRGQYARILSGGARLSPFKFEYTFPKSRHRDVTPAMSFEVVPESTPPTNVHAIVGRNGVGKTRLFHHMTEALAFGHGRSGYFEFSENSGGGFANLVSVSFSAFDRYLPLERSQDKQIDYSYIGLKRDTRRGGDLGSPKSPEMLHREFAASVLETCRGPKGVRWTRAIQALQTDSIFADSGITALSGLPQEELVSHAERLFSKFSSGHAIVLLTLTRLVEVVEERTLVMVDEPEAHLHPPLLSAFMRALSELMINRNGVAFIATHSPVILQEVPKSCVWIMRRSRTQVVLERPKIETFGENVGVLTREAFGLEVTEAGYHGLVRAAAEKAVSYDDLVSAFGGELGMEARALARAIISAKEGGDEVG